MVFRGGSGLKFCLLICGGEVLMYDFKIYLWSIFSTLIYLGITEILYIICQDTPTPKFLYKLYNVTISNVDDFICFRKILFKKKINDTKL